MDIIDLMMDFRNNGCVDQLTNVDISKDNLNVIVVNILSWLKLEYKRSLWITEGKKTELKPLELKDNYSWCVDLKRFIAGTKAFSAYFRVDENKFTFAKDIPIEEQSRLREKAYIVYNPQMHT